MTDRKTLRNRHPKSKRLDRKIRSLLFDKRALSVALSTLIITAGVIAAGIAVLYWAFAWGNVANHQYSDNVSNSQSAIQENLGFEYITYSGSQLTVYLINCGKSNNVTLARAYLWDNFSNPKGTYAIPSLYYTTNNAQIPSNEGLNIGDEGYFSLSLSLDSGAYYTLRVVTGRGRNFDQAFSTP
jgi:hypothetical protein